MKKKEDKKPPPYISVSQVRTYLLCGMKYYFQYFEKIKTFPTGPMIRGSSVDKAANDHFDIKADNGVGLKRKDFVDHAVSEHDNNAEVAEMDITKQTSRDRLAEISKKYHVTHAQKLTPLSKNAVQLKINGDIGLDIPVLGFADLITKDGVVIDNKVRKQNRVNDLTKDIQLVTYADVGNFSKVGIALVTDNKNPKAEIYTAQISDSSKSLVRERIKSVRNGIKKKGFLPAPEGSWYCSEKWCSFWNICPYGDG